jgi:hypothetical protein
MKKGEGKDFPVLALKAHGGLEIKLNSFLNSAPDGD